MKSKLHNLMIAPIITVVLAGLAPSVFADKPANFTFSMTLEGVNPCTNQPNEFTLFFDIYEHQNHSNVSVGRAIRTGWSTDGFETFAGGKQW